MRRGFLLLVIGVFDYFLTVCGNAEGDALNALKSSLSDPNNVLTSWDPTLVNPCTWFHVTCNVDNSVTRVDLGNANLSGQLVPELGQLPNLQYLELYSNNISGGVPDTFGNLTNLVSLDLYLNKLDGPIPDTFGKLSKLRFLRLNNNSLAGTIPMSLTTISTLQVLDLSYNHLSGVVPVNGSFSLFTPIRPNSNMGHLPLGKDGVSGDRANQYSSWSPPSSHPPEAYLPSVQPPSKPSSTVVASFTPTTTMSSSPPTIPA